jgi:hypothetical protein
MECLLGMLTTLSILLGYRPQSLLGAFAEFRIATMSLVMSVRLHGTTRLPVYINVFLLNLIFGLFFEILLIKFKFN